MPDQHRFFNRLLGGLELGVLVDEDGPRDFVKTSAGNLNDVFETRNHFAEFARVEINGKWFAISEDYEWKYHVRLKKKSESIENIDYNNDGDKIDVAWTDFQTVTDNTNEGF